MNSSARGGKLMGAAEEKKGECDGELRAGAMQQGELLRVTWEKVGYIATGMDGPQCLPPEQL
jgi:hypothetical protein